MLFDLIGLYFSLFILLIAPGYFLMKAILAKYEAKISAIEKLVITFALSITSVDFLIIVMNFFGMPLVRGTLLATILLFSAACFFVFKRTADSKINQDSSNENNSFFATLKNISYRQILIFLTILVLIMLVRSGYISRGIMPQTTDLGHHMYWAKVISDTGALPDYGMPDFIIGEHIIFGAMAILSGISFVSAMPVIVLLMINIFSLFALNILAYRVSENFTSPFNAKTISIMTFLIGGVLYAISSPQTKFVSGGVIGNIIGNLFIPLTMYFFLMMIKNRSKEFAMLFLLAGATLVYTHHLSSFVFLYAFSGFVLFSIVALFVIFRTNIKKTLNAILEIIKPFISVRNLILIFAFPLFVFFVHPPSYLNPSAIDTAVGVPVKSTRTGLMLGSIIQSAGPWRFFYATLGIIVLSIVAANKFFLKQQKNNKNIQPSIGVILSVVMVSLWMVMIYLMSANPALLRVDIPSNRIVSYITCPATILSAIGVTMVLVYARKKYSQYIFLLLFVMILGTGFVSGFSDISDSVRNNNGSNEKAVKQTYLAAEYLVHLAADNEMVLKDHINLSGDTWIKLYFMKGYRYPLSRSHLKRYEDPNSKRETCTRDMIAIPDSEIGKECFEKTDVKYIMLENGSENYQFDAADNFSRIYASEDTVIYMKN